MHTGLQGRQEAAGLTRLRAGGVVPVPRTRHLEQRVDQLREPLGRRREGAVLLALLQRPLQADLVLQIERLRRIKCEDTGGR